MKYIIPIIILSFVLLSCSKEEEGETDTDTTTVLEGTWKTACYTDSDNMTAIFTPTFAGNVLTLKDETHSDTSCATDYSLEENSHTFSMGDAGEFSITAGTTKRTPQSSAAVTAYNSANKCSANDWELNTEKDCSNDDAGDTDYGLYLLTTNLWLNIDDNKPYPESIPSNTRFKYVKQ